MIYTPQERDLAILSIGQGLTDLTNTKLYEDLESFNWIYIERLNGVMQKVTLTYSGTNLYKRLCRIKRII